MKKLVLLLSLSLGLISISFAQKLAYNKGVFSVDKVPLVKTDCYNLLKCMSNPFTSMNNDKVQFVIKWLEEFTGNTVYNTTLKRYVPEKIQYLELKFMDADKSCYFTRSTTKMVLDMMYKGKVLGSDGNIVAEKIDEFIKINDEGIPVVGVKLR